MTGADGAFRIDDVYQRLRGYEMAIQAKGYSTKQQSFAPGTSETPAQLKVTLAPGQGGQ